jgi:hypothetical protein
MLILINIAGFFSNFFKVLNWELLNNNNNIIIPYFISRSIKYISLDFTNYTDTTIYENSENIWEKMFYPIREYNKIDLLDKNNIFTYTYPSNCQHMYPYPLNNIRNGYIFCEYAIYNHPLLPQIRQLYHECYNKFKWTPYLKNHIENNIKLIPNPKKTVAVFLRCTVHYSGIKEYLKNTIDELKVIMQNYDKLFLVTMIKEVVKELTDVFGDKIILLQDKNMVETLNHDWGGVFVDNKYTPLEIDDYEKECVQCFTDVYLASTCDYILGGSSNMFLGALIINPTVKFKILDVFNNVNGS